MAINQNARIRDLLQDHPEVKKVLAKNGMMCPGCGGFENELLKNAARNHGVDPDKLLQEIRAAIKTR